MPFDRIDRHILTLLQSDGRISNSELADAVGLSPSACLRRVRALEDAGVIDRYVALLNQDRIGRRMDIFVEILGAQDGQKMASLRPYQAVGFGTAFLGSLWAVVGGS